MSIEKYTEELVGQSARFKIPNSICFSDVCNSSVKKRALDGNASNPEMHESW